MNYFDKDVMTPKVLQYRSLYHEDLPAAMDLFGEMHDTLVKVVHGVINTHKFYRFGDTDDLTSVALLALMGKSGLCKFDPSYTKYKGKKENLLFSFISLIAKQSIFFYTVLDSKRRFHEGATTDGFTFVADTGDPEDFIHSTDALMLNSGKFIEHRFINTPYERLYNYLLQHVKINGVFHKKLFYSDMIKTIGTNHDAFKNLTTVRLNPITRDKAIRCIRKFLKDYKYYLSEYLLECA